MNAVAAGRAAYNLTRTSLNAVSLETYRMKSHEQMVKEFLAQCEKDRPVATSRAYRRHKVLSEDDLKYRRAQELFAFGPGDERDVDDMTSRSSEAGFGLYVMGGDGGQMDLVGAASLIADRNAQEAFELAERRGEPYGGV